ncbi:putative ribonuclease H-like domain-containing protein [Tanacetum coccineum]
MHKEAEEQEVFLNGDAPTVALASAEGPIPPRTAEQKLARNKELKAKSTLLLAFPDEHLLKFHGIKDATTLWEAIKARSEGLDKTYDTFQKLIGQLEIHGEVISQEDANLKLLRTSSSTYVDDVLFSFFANQSNNLQLDNEDLEQINTDNLEEIDLEWQVAMLTMRVKRFLKKTGRNLNFNGKETVGFDKTKVECYSCHRRGYFARECKAPRNQWNRNGDAPRRIVPVETPANVLVVQDGICVYDWSFQAKEGITNFALMTYTSQGSSSSSSSDSEYDHQRDALNKSNIEIIGYQVGLESLEARIVIHEKNEAVYEDDIAFLKYDVQVKDISIKDLKNQLEEALKEKDDLKLKLEKFEESSKNLTKLINSQISAKDKAGLGYDSQMNESEVVHSVFNCREINVDDSPVNDRFKIVKGFYAVPPPYTGNYMPSRPDLSFTGLDDFVYKTKIMVEKPVLNNKERVTGQREIRLVWNNAQRVNHQNKFTRPHPKRNFVPTIVVTNSGQVPVNTTKQSSPRAATSISTARPVNTAAPKSKGNPQYTLQDQGIFDSGYSRHMTGNKSFLTDYQEVDGGFVAFARSPKGGKITRKGKIRTGKLDFEDVYFVKELKFNLFSVLQMCDKKNSVLFTKTECLVLSPDFKLLDESQVLLKVPRQNNMYSFDLKNVVPSGGLTCLFAKATIDESNLWHRRLGHINFKTMNKLVRGNLVRGLPSKLFENDHSCVACQKGKQHKASCKTKLNRVLLTKPHNKTPYELLLGRPPSISFMRPFGCPMTILNILDPLGKFDGKANEGFLLVTTGNQTNGDAGIETNVNVGQAGQEKAFDHEYILLPLMLSNSPLSLSTQSTDDKDADEVPDKGDDDVSQRNGQEKEQGASNKEDDQHVQDFKAKLDSLLVQQKEGYANSTNRDNTASLSISTAGPSINTASENINTGSPIINTARLFLMNSMMMYVDDIIFGSTKKSLSVEFEQMILRVTTTPSTGKIYKSSLLLVTTLSYRYALTVNPTIYTSCIKQFWATPKAKTVNGEVQIQALVDGKKSCPNEEHVPAHSNDPLLSGEDRLKLNKLMELCTNLSQRVLDLKNIKTSQAEEITKLTERIKNLKRRNKSRTPGLKRLRKVGRTARIESFKDEGLGDQKNASKQGRKIADLDADAEEIEVEKVVSTAEVTTVSVTTITVDELTLAQTLIEIKTAKHKAVTTAATTTITAVTRPKASWVVVQEPSKFRRTTSSSQISQLPQAKDKGKEKMAEPKKTLKKKDQILIDEEIAQKLQAQLNAELEEEEKHVKQREEDANIAEWDNVQAMIDADYELATRLQAQEQEELTVEEKSKLFVELMDKRKKHFARLRAKEQRRKPPTKAQKRNQMCTYLKNMAGFTHNQLKNKSFNVV